MDLRVQMAAKLRPRFPGRRFWSLFAWGFFKVGRGGAAGAFNAA